MNTFGVNERRSHPALFRQAGRRSFAFGQLEAIAGSTHRLQVARILRIDLDFLTDAPHININRAGSDKARIAPDRVQQVVAAENPARMARQIIEQPELGRRGGGQLAAHRSTAWRWRR